MSADFLKRHDEEPAPNRLVVCVAADSTERAQKIADELSKESGRRDLLLVTYPIRTPHVTPDVFLIVFENKGTSDVVLDEVQSAYPKAGLVRFTGHWTVDHLLEGLGIRS